MKKFALLGLIVLALCGCSEVPSRQRLAEKFPSCQIEKIEDLDSSWVIKSGSNIYWAVWSGSDNQIRIYPLFASEPFVDKSNYNR